MLIEIDEAEKILINSGNVIIPTETVYGLAASIYSQPGIEGIFKLKNRPKENPLIIHCSSLNQVLELVKDPPDSFFLLTKAFWPGPLTVILEAKEGINQLITAGLNTVAVRIPNHIETLNLISKTGPLVAPSANLSGTPSSTKIKHLEHDFGIDFPILKGDEPNCGLESTIIGWINEKWVLLRYGFIPKEEIEDILGEPIDHSNLQISPGTRFRHYSPKAKIFYGIIDLIEVEAIIGFENRHYEGNLPFYSLGNDNEPEKIAYNLFALFRKVDEDGFSRVWIDINLPNKGLYHTIIERILKAAIG